MAAAWSSGQAVQSEKGRNFCESRFARDLALDLFIAAAVFVAGEMISAASFFFLPFAIGALVAALVSLLGVNIIVGWVLFIVVSSVAFAGLWPSAGVSSKLMKPKKALAQLAG